MFASHRLWQHGLLQVVDENLGPTTKRDFEIALVPAGDALIGQLVDFLGRAPGTQQQLGTDERMPMFALQPGLQDREPISEPLVTGIKVPYIRCAAIVQHMPHRVCRLVPALCLHAFVCLRGSSA